MGTASSLKEYERVAAAEEITSTRTKRVTIAGVEIVLLRAEGHVFAVENFCPHQHVSAFHEAQVEGCVIRCPMHGWTFDLRTGDAVAGSGHLRICEVREVDGSLFVHKPQAPTTSQFGLWEP